MPLFKGLKTRPKKWKTPSDASKRQLADVSRYLARLLRKTGPDKDAEVYQEQCAKQFDQVFDNDAWDDWFDTEIDQLSGNHAKPAKPWKSPLDAPEKDLAAVSKYLGKLLEKAGHGDDTDPEVFQEKCAKEFGQAFDNGAWDEWFDKEVERLETSGASSSRKVWETPADMFLADLAAVLKYLGELIDEAGPDGHVKTHTYQEKCAKRFDQEFDSDAWDEWFDETIEQLEKGSSERRVWKVPSDATKMDRAEIRSFMSDLLDKARPNESIDADMYQEKCSAEFDQEFDSHAWDSWFDKEIERLKEYRV